VLVLQGERDTFGTAATLASEVGAAVGAAEVGTRRGIGVIAVPGADHGMKALASSPLNAAAVAELLTSSVVAFIGEVI
jgi:predicted alpha/beta-hydrolase family hydrolase